MEHSRCKICGERHRLGGCPSTTSSDASPKGKQPLMASRLAPPRASEANPAVKRPKSSDGGSRERPFVPADAAGGKSGTVTARRANRKAEPGLEVGAKQTPGSSMSFGLAEPVIAGQALGPSEANSAAERWMKEPEVKRTLHRRPKTKGDRPEEGLPEVTLPATAQDSQLSGRQSGAGTGSARASGSIPLVSTKSARSSAGSEQGASIPKGAGSSPAELAKRKRAPNGTFDRKAYQREYMRGWRKKQ